MKEHGTKGDDKQKNEKGHRKSRKKRKKEKDKKKSKRRRRDKHKVRKRKQNQAVVCLLLVTYIDAAVQKIMRCMSIFLLLPSVVVAVVP